MQHESHDHHAGHDMPAPVAPAAHGGHDKHAGHDPEAFRRQFWVVLLLTIPVVIWSREVQDWLGYAAPSFAGSDWIPPVLGTAVFVYGGLVFLRGARTELANRQPGMMTLISLAIAVAFIASWAATLGVFEVDVWWELATLITVMSLGHWLEMRAIRQARGALSALAALLPDTAERVTEGGVETVKTDELRPPPGTGTAVLWGPTSAGELPASCRRGPAGEQSRRRESLDRPIDHGPAVSYGALEMLHSHTTAAPRARPRPMLLALVFGVFLVLIGVTATALITVTSLHLSSATLGAVVSRDRSLVALFVNSTLQRSDLDADGPRASRAVDLEAKLVALTAQDEILGVEIRAADGTILVSSTPDQRGARPPISAGMRDALAGKPSIAIVERAAMADLGPTVLDAENLVREYLPLLSDQGETLAVFALWRDAAPLLARIEAARRDVVLVTVVASALLAAVLFFVFRAAQKRISRQHAQLLEAEHRDPLTSLLNHGAVVSLLAGKVEAARQAGSRLGLALIDIDNFRLLNDTHGHEAADQVLLRVSELVDQETGDSRHVARYGPDEFLLILTDAGVPEVEAAVDRIRVGLTELTMQFGESEQLPVTVSVGICLYPEHADSVTELLTVGAVAVREAKASGGDGVRVARVAEGDRESSGSFDVLQGLVIAIDTKDRYTKRHSEDVARYAVFLARRIGFDPEQLRTIHLAGLLHDVGKIGIPDTLLRKPSRLTAEEFHIFKQHVALGDAIVRDVPDVELVRAGIRHHHERWDGRGYLEGLEGEAIPFLGRILAVADAFSAMTTTRPYRKALPIEEALKRLGDAAGSQLQEELVAAFIEGIETAPDAPLPGEPPAGLWTPTLKVA